VCYPEPVYRLSTTSGSVFSAGALWLLDLPRFGAGAAADEPCGLQELRDLRDKVSACVTDLDCGDPFDDAELRSMLKPFDEGRAEVATMAGIPVEVLTTPTRMLVLMTASSDPIAVLEHMDPKLKAKLGASSSSSSSSSSSPVGDVGAAEELGGCCGGLCTPCDKGQCEPRPGVIIRASIEVHYECDCFGICDAKDLPDKCPCRELCAVTHPCSGAP
jgi:hypothetical protein